MRFRILTIHPHDSDVIQQVNLLDSKRNFDEKKVITKAISDFQLIIKLFSKGKAANCLSLSCRIIIAYARAQSMDNSQLLASIGC